MPLHAPAGEATVIVALATAFSNTGSLNLGSTLNFGPGRDTFANSTRGITSLGSNSLLQGLETFTQAGRINLNAFTLSGSGALTSTGFIDTNGSAGFAGFTALNNTGTLDLAAGIFSAPIGLFSNSGVNLADEGASTITRQTNLSNSGTLGLQDGAVGDVLTINSDFAGSGTSTLQVDFGATSSEQLVINGAASGSTRIDARFLGGSLLNLDGVRIVDAVSSTSNAFVLGGVVGQTDLSETSLVQRGADYFLVTKPTAVAFDPLRIPVLARSLWHQSADEVIAGTRIPSGMVGLNAWGQVYGSSDEQGGNGALLLKGAEFEVDNELSTDRLGVQMGLEYAFSIGRVGLTGGYATAKANSDSDFELRARGWNIGIYSRLGGELGPYSTVLAKRDHFDLDIKSGALAGEGDELMSSGIDGSLGYRFRLSQGRLLDAAFGLSYVSTEVDDLNTSASFAYDFEKSTSTRARAGMRAVLGERGILPFFAATAYHEFERDGRVNLLDGASSYSLGGGGRATWLRLEGGLMGSGNHSPMLNAWMDIGDHRSIGLRAGFRFAGAR